MNNKGTPEKGLTPDKFDRIVEKLQASDNRKANEVFKFRHSRQMKRLMKPKNATPFANTEQLVNPLDATQQQQQQPFLQQSQPLQQVIQPDEMSMDRTTEVLSICKTIGSPDKQLRPLSQAKKATQSCEEFGGDITETFDQLEHLTQLYESTTLISDKPVEVPDMSDNDEEVDLSVDDYLLIPKRALEFLFGDEGVDHLQETSGAKIYIEPRTEDETKVACLIEGNEEQVNFVKEQIQLKLNEFNSKAAIDIQDESAHEATLCSADTVPKVVYIERAGKVGSLTVIWTSDNKLFRGYVKTREKDQRNKTITCSSAKCSYSFRARAPEDLSLEFWNSENWDTLPSKRKTKTKTHTAISDAPILTLQRREDKVLIFPRTGSTLIDTEIISKTR